LRKSSRKYNRLTKKKGDLVIYMSAGIIWNQQNYGKSEQTLQTLCDPSGMQGTPGRSEILWWTQIHQEKWSQSLLQDPQKSTEERSNPNDLLWNITVAVCGWKKFTEIKYIYERGFTCTFRICTLGYHQIYLQKNQKKVKINLVV
jgi:hypothetical protein